MPPDVGAAAAAAFAAERGRSPASEAETLAFLKEARAQAPEAQRAAAAFLAPLQAAAPEAASGFAGAATLDVAPQSLAPRFDAAQARPNPNLNPTLTLALALALTLTLTYATKARDLLDRAIDEADTPQLRLQRAQQSAALDAPHRALADALVARRARPGWAEAAQLLGRVYAALGDAAAAVALLD